MKKLPLEFYIRDDVTEIARSLLGKVLCTDVNGEGITSGIIVEAEAYAGRDDMACHANAGSRTKRTEIMYAKGGHAYVYFIYGMHHLFNVVTNVEGKADAVLIRALEPAKGIDLMLKRRKMKTPEKRLTSGPGVLSQALGITTDLYGTCLSGDKIWIEDSGMELNERDIVATARVGVDYAGKDAHKAWRFYVKENPWVSRV